MTHFTIPKDQIELRVSLDELDARRLLEVVYNLVHAPGNFTRQEYAAIEKVYENLFAAVCQYDAIKNLWRIEIRNAAGAKRGELTVIRAEVKETVERLAKNSPNFNYVCFPKLSQ